jgi:hypothetical protein
MWCFKKNEEDEICIAAAGFIFLASKMLKKKTKRHFWVRPTLVNTILNYSLFHMPLLSC